VDKAEMEILLNGNHLSCTQLVLKTLSSYGVCFLLFILLFSKSIQIKADIYR